MLVREYLPVLKEKDEVSTITDRAKQEVTNNTNNNTGIVRSQLTCLSMSNIDNNMVTVKYWLECVE